MGADGFPILHEPGTYALAPRCRCEYEYDAKGHWVFEHEGRIHDIRPHTQSAKNAWLASQEAPGPAGERARVAALRWRCKGCGTVQDT